MVAPWIVDQPMNGRIFETRIETQLAPTLQKGNVVIYDNVAFHKSKRAEEPLTQSQMHSANSAIFFP
jgi:transposase